MRQGTCSECGAKGALGTYFRQGDKVYCDACTTKLAEPGTGKFLGLERPSSIIDPTICTGCKADNGNSEFPVIGERPFCVQCQQRFLDRPYPQWLKRSLAFLLILLAVALVHGKKYFRAGREMYVGEKLMSQGHYGEATPHLQQTVQVAPNSDKAVLLLAKASLLSGNPEVADTALRGHDGGRFEDTPEYREVAGVFDRAVSGIKETNQALELARQSGKEDEAARLMHHAAETYPEMPRLGEMAQEFDEGVAFAHKDYDRYLAITENLTQLHPESAEYWAEMAGALACKYAVTGNLELRQKAEAMLEKSRLLAQGSSQAMKAYEEYEVRVRHRLDSREIIDKAEYDRRFRPDKSPAKN